MLPPCSHALRLLERFEAIAGPDFQWFLRQRFKDRIFATYYDRHSTQSTDRLWLCRFFLVMALAESYSDEGAHQVSIQDDQNISIQPLYAPSPPGATYFEHALSLFQGSYEEPTVEQIEALNLMVCGFISHDKRALILCILDLLCLLT